MAFLCPVRIKRNKKKKPLNDEAMPGLVPSMGRITGSASIETLVRVGIEKENGLAPESKMVVLHDFTPCVDDELEVKRGQIVHVLYQENDWVYVISDENQEGFIPHSYCAQYGTQMATLALNVRKKLPRDSSNVQNSSTSNNITTGPAKATSMSGLPTSNQQNYIVSSDHRPSSELVDGNNFDGKIQQAQRKDDQNIKAGPSTYSSAGFPYNQSMFGGGFDPSRSNSIMSSDTSSQSDVHPFTKESSGKYVVLYSYQAQDENDLSIERGQVVTLLNSEDPDWYWVSRSDQCEGFVPSGFIYPLDALQRQQVMQNQGCPMTTTGLGPVSASMAQKPFPVHPVGPGIGNPRPNANSNSNSAGSTVINPLGSSGNSSGPSSYSTSGVNSLVTAGSINQSFDTTIPPSMISPQEQPRNGLELRYRGTELVILYDYQAQVHDDLSVRRGDYVYADLSNQTVDGWLWAYSIKQKRYGFIPKAYARPPAMTNL